MRRIWVLMIAAMLLVSVGCSQYVPTSYEDPHENWGATKAAFTGGSLSSFIVADIGRGSSLGYTRLQIDLDAYVRDVSTSSVPEHVLICALRSSPSSSSVSGLYEVDTRTGRCRLIVGADRVGEAIEQAFEVGVGRYVAVTESGIYAVDATAGGPARVDLVAEVERAEWTLVTVSEGEDPALPPDATRIRGDGWFLVTFPGRSVVPVKSLVRTSTYQALDGFAKGSGGDQMRVRGTEGVVAVFADEDPSLSVLVTSREFPRRATHATLSNGERFEIGDFYVYNACVVLSSE